MIKATIILDKKCSDFQMEMQDATKLEAMMLVYEMGQRMHELLHLIDDDVQMEWSEEEDGKHN